MYKENSNTRVSYSPTLIWVTLWSRVFNGLCLCSSHRRVSESLGPVCEVWERLCHQVPRWRLLTQPSCAVPFSAFVFIFQASSFPFWTHLCHVIMRCRMKVWARKDLLLSSSHCLWELRQIIQCLSASVILSLIMGVIIVVTMNWGNTCKMLRPGRGMWLKLCTF